MADERATTGAWTPPSESVPTFAERPGGPPAQLHVAGWWSRVGATLLDGVIVSAAVFAVSGIAAAAGGSGAFQATLGVAYVAAIFYAPVMLALNHGQTLGKMAANIRVVHRDGAPIGFGRAFLREVPVKFICGIIPFLDVLWPLWQQRNRALHDLVVATQVIEA